MNPSVVTDRVNPSIFSVDFLLPQIRLATDAQGAARDWHLNVQRGE